MRRSIVVPLAAAVALGLGVPSASAATTLKSLQKSLNALKAKVNAQDAEINTLHRDIAFVNNQRVAMFNCLQRSLIDDGQLASTEFATTFDLPDLAGQNVPFVNGGGQVWMLGVKNNQGCINAIVYHSPWVNAPAAVRAAKVAASRARGD
jgi:hypothetical protein